MSASGLFIGIMSGTSLDGIDAALCRFDWSGDHPRLELLAEASLPWPGGIRETLYSLATEESVSIDTLTRTHFLIPQYYSDIVKAVLDNAGLSPQDVLAIGLHGQTVRHLPTPKSISPEERAVAGTLQLGSGPALAALTGIDVVSDFRSADIALGGQGAPLVPMFDNAFLRSSACDRVALNVGGIANITWLPRDLKAEVVAFDTGPGNMLIDALCRKHFGEPFDRDGAIARSGVADEGLLERLLAHSYFQSPPPKSTGRELFGSEFLTRFEEEVVAGRLSSTDAVATATELTARSIADSIHTLTHSSAEVLVAGGGTKNTFLMERLRALLPKATVETTEPLGIPVQSKEAIVFAFFAFAYINNIYIHLPSTTGASRRLLPGSLARGRA